MYTKYELTAEQREAVENLLQEFNEEADDVHFEALPLEDWSFVVDDRYDTLVRPVLAFKHDDGEHRNPFAFETDLPENVVVVNLLPNGHACVDFDIEMYDHIDGEPLDDVAAMGDEDFISVEGSESEASVMLSYTPRSGFMHVCIRPEEPLFTV